MEDTLQKLIDQVYTEGIDKSNEKGEEIITKAKEKAEEIIAKANHEAQKTKNEANAEAADIRANVMAELGLAEQESISNLRQQVADMIGHYALGEPLKKAFDDSVFLQRLIETIMQKWNPEAGELSLNLLLPENEQNELSDFLLKKSRETLDSGIEIRISSSRVKGFKVVFEKDGYFLSFTHEDFEILFRNHLRKKTLELFNQSRK